MKLRELAIKDAWEVTPSPHSDDRGVFLEWYRLDVLAEAIGHPVNVAQGNYSQSRKGVLRGIHFADVPPSQAKYVKCMSGAVLDVVVDIRVGSPTYGEWEAVTLDDRSHRAVYIAEGLGHAFIAMTDDATVNYLCSTPYTPSREHELHPFDPDIGIRWPEDIEPVLSPKDAAAPTLREAEEAGKLPSYLDCLAHYEELRARVR